MTKFIKKFTNRRKPSYGARKYVLGKRKRNYIYPTTSKARYASRAERIGSEVGAALGSFTGMPATGRALGKFIGKKAAGIPSVFGRGDYYVKSNSLLNPGDTPPQFSSSGGRTVRVRHREYIGDVLGTKAFKQTGYPINPGLEETFPWLCSVAANFECYRVQGMLFEFKSLSGDALTSTNNSLGAVIMATQYNSGVPGFQNKQQMENYEFAQSCKPSSCMMHYVACEPHTLPISELYVRTGTINNLTQPVQMYDLGKFWIATQGMQADDATLGELWVTYDIELMKPKLTQGEFGYSINYYRVKFSNPVPANLFTNNAPANVKASQSNMAVTLGVNKDGYSTVTLPNSIAAGDYFWVLEIIGNAGATGATLAAVNYANADPNYIFKGDSIGVVGFTSGATLVYYGAFSVTGPGAQIIFDKNMGIPSSVAACTLTMTQMNGLAN